MTVVADLVRMFNRINVRLGSPALRIYVPVADWTLDAGVTYNAITDSFVDGDGDPVAQDYAAQDYDTVAYIPIGGGQPVMLSVPGATEADGVSVAVRYSSAIAAALDEAWALEVPEASGNLYRITNRRNIPDGVDTPAFVQLDLVQRGE